MNFLDLELNWISNLIVVRMKSYFNQNEDENTKSDIIPPFVKTDSPYENFLMENCMGFEDRVYLILSFIPLLKPQLLDCFNVKNSDTGTRFVEFGCEESENGLIPTLETVLFILAGGNIEERIKLIKYFLSHPVFSNITFFNNQEGNKSPLQKKLIPSEELVDMLILEKPFSPSFSESFPARKIVTERNWSELVLDDATMDSINEIKMWAQHGEKVRNEWHLKDKIKPGYRALFYGPSGSGKTFTATLLGKETGRDVYCVDLSMVVSKYIGETEKNLSKIFELAEGRNWILFFDEADALFGKRTGTKDAHDKYANQEVAYLLQRIEGYEGLVILSTNLKSNIDDAFSRRFQSMVKFSTPNAEQREHLWKETFSNDTIFEPSVDIKSIAKNYELGGGSILNVVQYSSIKAMSRNENIIRDNDIKEGIRKELLKEGKLM